MVNSSVWARLRPMPCRPMKKTLFSCVFVLLACCDGSVLENILSSHQQSGNHAVSYLMSREQVFKMLSDGANLTDGRGAKSLGELAGALASLAQVSATTGNATYSVTADPATVASIRNMVQLFINELVIEHNESMIIVNDVSGFELCAQNLTTTTTTTGDSSTNSTFTSTTINTATNCSYCWEEVNNSQVGNETCWSNLTYYQGPMYEVCNYYNGTNRNLSEVQQERCHETWTGSYEAYLERDIYLLAELTYARENCSNLTDLYVNETTQCQNLSDGIPDKIRRCLDCEMLNESNTTGTTTSCVVAPERLEICNEYEACFASANRTFSTRCTNQQYLSISRKAEYRALMRINCLLDVLVVDISLQYDTLVNCINTTYSTDQLTIVCGTPPDQLPCNATLCT